MDRALLSLLRGLHGDLERAVTLATLAGRAGRSRFHLHRALRRMLGETPRQFVQRLRLERAAGQLVVTDAAVLDIALSCGYSSHEVFTRAFRRQFGCSPVAYRAGALSQASQAARAAHVALTDAIGPCVRLYHIPTQHPPRKANMPTLSMRVKWRRV